MSRTCKYCNVKQNEIFDHPYAGYQPATFVNGRGFVCYCCKNGRDRYGLNRLEQLQILEKQNGCCKLCQKPTKLHNGRPPKSAVIDHEGTPGCTDFVVRGVLCHDCNNLLGVLDKSEVGPYHFIDNLYNYYALI